MRAPGGAFRAPAAAAPNEGEREVSGDGEDLGECPAVGDLGDPQPGQKMTKTYKNTRCKMNQNHREVIVLSSVRSGENGFQRDHFQRINWDV